jgi:mannose/cellobiose epimerase-like protein (N-acyl-D-glucosamine 2-epimerase family)
MKSYHSSITIIGEVESIDAANAKFSLKLLTNDKILVHVSKTTFYEVLRNVGDDWRDRVRDPEQTIVEQKIGNRSVAPDPSLWDAKWQLLKYLKSNLMVCIQGIFSEHGNTTKYSARRVVLMHSEPGCYGWEDTHWWLQQVNTLFEQWLDVLFQSRREFTENDFSEFYRTNLDLLGGATGDLTQECATMSRFLYGLSSAYLLTGNERSLSAARACAKYLVNAYSNPSHDGEYIFWKFGRVKDGKSTKEIIGSLNPDDRGSFALYEQIYVLSGLTQYYRITQDTWILGYIVRTIAAFEKFYFDEERPDDPCFTGKGGYYSHIDPVTMRPDSPSLDATGNREKKNWNSIGDHIPAYLINLLVSIDPLPGSDKQEFWVKLRDLCQKILDDCVFNILEHFAPEEGTLFVNERFHKDWNPDRTWGWQQNRGIVGHNLKISWNLTRCAHYYDKRAEEAQREDNSAIEKKYTSLAQRCYDFALMLGRNMRKVGVDLVRGGIFDALERFPANSMPTEFAWSSTKDFWQQEQAILAYYIMHRNGNDEAEKTDFLQLARLCSAFWSLFFIDHDNRKIYFRTTESGEPVIEGQYGIQGGHAIAGYHAFELNYLAHLYIRTFVDRGEGHHDSFVLHFRPLRNSSIKTLNVMPDFFRPGDLKITNIKINGVSIPIKAQHSFQIDISNLPKDSVILVEYLPIGRKHAQTEKNLMAERAKTACLQVDYDVKELKTLK